MKRLGITGGHWIFFVGVSYLCIGLFSIYKGFDITLAGPLYIFFLSMPFWFPPLGRAINLNVEWDRKMFDWFKKKDGDSNVVPFPELKSVPKMPETPPPPEKPVTVFYRFGITDNNRLAFQMGYSEITMSKEGVQNLIDQLEFYKASLDDDE